MVEEKEIKKLPQLKEVFDGDWKDIGHENYRTYIFIEEGKVVRLTIEEPAIINISKSGGHRILTKYNESYYIPYKWIGFYFETDDNVGWRF